jgi:hypothetical protein
MRRARIHASLVVFLTKVRRGYGRLLLLARLLEYALLPRGRFLPVLEHGEDDVREKHNVRGEDCGERRIRPVPWRERSKGSTQHDATMGEGGDWPFHISRWLRKKDEMGTTASEMLNMSSFVSAVLEGRGSGERYWAIQRERGPTSLQPAP